MNELNEKYEIFTQTHRGRRKKETSETADRIKEKNLITKLFRLMIAFPFKTFSLKIQQTDIMCLCGALTSS